MFKILFVFFCIVSNIFSETFGIDVPVEGIWRIDTAKKGESIEVANMVGFNVALKEPTAQLNHKNTPINSQFNGIKSTFRVQFLI